MLTLRRQVDEGTVASTTAGHPCPGERVRSDTTVRYAGEDAQAARTRQALVGDGVLTVRETIVDEEGRILLSFMEVPGEHNANGFMQPDGYERHYGVLVVVDDEPWIVPLDRKAEGRPRVDGAPRRVSFDLDRLGRHYVGPFSPEELLSMYADEPGCGEFVTSEVEPGLHRLDGIPWRSEADAVEAQVARTAVEDHRVAEVMAPTP